MNREEAAKALEHRMNEIMNTTHVGWNTERLIAESKALQTALVLLSTPRGEISDGYHTFNELYHHRAVLFSVIVRCFQDKAWKAKQHHDGTMYDGMFIVGTETPDGQATYHYDLDPYWYIFECKEIDKAPEWDGHSPDQAIERIGKLCPEPPGGEGEE